MIKSHLVDKIDNYGNVVIDTDTALESLLNGDSIDGIYIDDDSEIDTYNHSVDSLSKENFPYIKPKKEHKQSSDVFLKNLSTSWYIPPEYMEIDIISFLYERCKNKDEVIRMAEELEEFNKRKQLKILNVMIYLVDKFRDNNVVWGIGRGSSVSCFCFYLIGINKINPIKYDIPYTEFFKED